MLTIYGHPMSTCTRKVLMTLAETNTPHEFTVVEFATGDHKKPPHITRQPFGQVPALDDDGFQMFESRAMARYINDKVGGSLVPKDAKERAVMDQWMSIETSNFTPHVMKFVYEHIMHRKQEAAVLEAAGKGVEAALAVMETRLAASPYLAGQEISLADICFMPYFEYAMGTPVKDMLAKHPHVMAWWNRVSERPTWRKVANRA